MRVGVVVLVVISALIGIPTGYALLAETPVLVGPRHDLFPAADWNGSESVLVWERSRAGHPNRFDGWVRVGSNPPIKLNLGGTGLGGGINYPTVVYQRILRGQSNLYFYDLSNDSRPAPPAGVNTPKWEYNATISAEWLLFGRDDNRSPVERIVLHNTNTGDERLLAVERRARPYLLPGQVNGDWATYTRCKPVCNVVLYDIVNDSRQSLPKPPPSTRRHQYASSVTTGGTVYLVRSGIGCGRNVKIVRYGSGDPVNGTVVADLSSGRDIYRSFVRENADGSVDLFYDRVRCSTGRWDVYKLTDPPPGP